MLRKKLRLSQLDENTEQDKSIPNKDASGEANIDTTHSIYFRKVASDENDIPEKFLQHELDLNQHLKNLTFNAPIKYVYNPLEYAYDPHANFVRKYCRTKKKILFVGMNPGPHGMCQTGIPFGEVKLVSEWYKIEGEVLKPAVECPKRRILGFGCHISEPSGKRFGNFFKEICETPENFFKHCFIHNMCPLAFLDEGKNITPKDIKGPVKKELEKHCIETLLKIIRLLNVEIVIALGRYVEKQLEAILGKDGDVKIIYMNHPSPQAPGNWQEKARKVLVDNDLLQYFQSQ